MTAKAIIFDLDETLIEDCDATERAMLKACSYAQARYSIDPYQLRDRAYYYSELLWAAAPTFPYCDFIGISAAEGLWGQFVGEEPNLQALRAWVAEYRLETWQRALADLHVTNVVLAGDLAEHFQQERRSCYRLFPESVGVLEQLRTTYKLALLTNGASDLQREKVRQLDLARYFETVVVSGEVGAGKPDPEVFMRVVENLSVQPAETVMVGDSLARDIIGAHRVGMKGVWVNRVDGKCGEQYLPIVYAEIVNLDELPNVL